MTSWVILCGGFEYIKMNIELEQSNYLTCTRGLRPLHMSPVDRAGSLTGTNFTLGSYEKFRFSPVSEMRKGRRRVVARNSRNKANTVKHKIITFTPIIALATLIAVSQQLNGMLMMWKIQQAMQDDAEFIRRIHPAFIPVTGLKCSYGKIFSPLTEIPVGKTEISGTEPARPLI